MRAAFPFPRAKSQVSIRIYSPRPPHSPQAALADEILPLPQCGSCLARARANRRFESSQTAAARDEFYFFGDARRNASELPTVIREFCLGLPEHDFLRIESDRPRKPRAPFRRHEFWKSRRVRFRQLRDQLLSLLARSFPARAQDFLRS